MFTLPLPFRSLPAAPPGRLAAVLLAALGALPLPASAQAPGPPGTFATAAARQAADSLLRSLDRPDAPGLVAAVVEGGSIAWQGAAGLANLSHRVPMTPETAINVGSTAKTLTAAAVVQLAQEGALSLDDDVRTHLPELPDLGTPVTLRHLLSHTSGYREFLNALAVGGWRIEEADFVHPDEVLRVVQRQPALQNAPGAAWNYNNTGFVLLARVVERVTGTPFEAWVRDRILDPLEMTNSHIRSVPGQVIPGAAYGYLPRPGGNGYMEARDVGAAVGAGAFYTTVGDLARWMRVVAGEVEDWAPVMEEMTQPTLLTDGTPTAYGLGMEVDREGGLRRIHHPGGDIAHRAHFAWFPELNAGIIVASNGGGGGGAPVAALTRIFFGDRMAGGAGEEGAEEEVHPDPAGSDAAPVSSDALARLAGRYELEVQPGFVLAIRPGEEGLVAQATGQPPFPLTATSDSTFLLEAVGARLVFHADSALTLHQGGAALLARRVAELDPAVALDDFEGRYYSAEFETFYTVAAREGELVMEHRRRDPVRLTPAGDSVFVGPFPFFRVTFQRGEDGSVTGFLADAIRARDLHFERVR